MTDIYLADCSEYQTNVDAQAYLQNHKSIICRVHNGYRPDNLAKVRIPYLRSHAFTGVGWYQYLVAGRDPVVQAQEFVALVGPLRANEFPVLDIEEGYGDQTARAQAWFGVVDNWANLAATLYTNPSFLLSNLRMDALVPRPLWLADYTSVEPTIAHVLWQANATSYFGAITPSWPVDGNVFHGDDDAFIYTMRHGRSE